MQIKLGSPKKFEQVKFVREDKIPTRFDDIQKEILLDRVKDYFGQKFIPGGELGKTYKLGDVIGDKLNNIV